MSLTSLLVSINWLSFAGVTDGGRSKTSADGRTHAWITSVHHQGVNIHHYTDYTPLGGTSAAMLGAIDVNRSCFTL
jgi:hypothetical protein